MNTQKVSILVPIYNVEKYLPKCLDSIFSQTYQNVEYVFVDDCSTDASLDVLREMLQKYRISRDSYIIVTHSINEGIAVSRADCIANAHGDYVQFVDSDDWIDPSMTESLVNATCEGKIDMVGCYYIKDFLNSTQSFHSENYTTSTAENMLMSINYDISTVLWKLLIRRSLFDNFTITPHVDIVEDYIISIKLFYYANSFAIVDKYLYHYVQYNQCRVSLQSMRSIKNHIKGVKEVESFFVKNGLLSPKIEHLLTLRKFNIKSNFLTSGLFNVDLYRETFPESNRIWREINYSNNEKIKFWLAEKRLFFVLILINKFKKYKNEKS